MKSTICRRSSEDQMLPVFLSVGLALGMVIGAVTDRHDLGFTLGMGAGAAAYIPFVMLRRRRAGRLICRKEKPQG